MRFPAVGNATFIITASGAWNVSFKFVLSSGCWCSSSLPPTVNLSFPNSPLCRAVLLDKSPPNYQDRRGSFSPATIVVTADNSFSATFWQRIMSVGDQTLSSESGTVRLCTAIQISILSPAKCHKSEYYITPNFEATSALPKQEAPGTQSILPSIKGSAIAACGGGPSLETSFWPGRNA